MTNNIQWPTVDHFMNAEEIVADAVEKISEEDAKYLVENRDQHTLAAHLAFTQLGMWLRNTYHLWHPDNPHTSKKWVPEMVDGCDASPFHPDNYSGKVVGQLLTKLKEKYNA